MVEISVIFSVMVGISVKSGNMHSGYRRGANLTAQNCGLLYIKDIVLACFLLVMFHRTLFKPNMFDISA